MMNYHVTLNDGTFLYSEDGVKEYLENLGFDIEALTYMLSPAQALYDEGSLIDKENCDKYEELYSEIDYEVRTGYNIIEDLCNKLASGKGGTKVQYADRIKRAYFENFESL